MTDKFTAGLMIRVKPVYNSQGVWVGSIECWGSEMYPYYTVDNQLARRFNITPNREFKTAGAIMRIINGG